jgi:hypothetical protein
MFTPPVAALAVVAAGLLTPGYDPLARTVSRLAAPGMPFAITVDVAIGMVGVSCFALALAIRGTSAGRAALVAAGAGFVLAAIVHLDPSSATATAAHRGASALAVLGLTLAPILLWRAYGRGLLVLGIGELAALAVALALLPTSFEAWGAWERAVLLLGLSSLVVLARTIPSTEDTASARTAHQSSTGA